MSMSLEKIDMLKERANISYKEAKEALEKFDGDLVEALIYLESNEKTTASPQPRHDRDNKDYRDYREHREERRQKRRERDKDVLDQIKQFISKLHKTSFIVSKKDRKLLDIPLTVALIIILIALPASIFLLILPYVFGYKILVLNEDGSKFNFDEAAKDLGKSKQTETKNDSEHFE